MSTAWISLALIAAALLLVGVRTWRRLEHRGQVARLVADSRSVFDGLTLSDLTNPDEKLRAAIADLELREASLLGEQRHELDRHVELARHIVDPDHPHHQPYGCLVCEADRALAPGLSWRDADVMAANLAETAGYGPERKVREAELAFLEQAYALPSHKPERRA